jgi:glucosamine kinase
MVLAVDLGQSGTRLRWTDGYYESARAKRANETPTDVLRDVFDEVTDLYNIRCDVVALSLTGIYGDVPDPQKYGELTWEYFGAKDVAVIDDGLAGLIGALGSENGVALSIGSGVVAVGNCEKVFAHADGLGHVFGDVGGGFWLGKHALERTLATRQGREEDEELLAFLHSEVDQFDRLESNTGLDANLLCITTARRVLEGADAKIMGAITIRNHGARGLAKTVRGAWLAAGGDSGKPFALALLGGLSRNSGYEDVIHESVLSLLPLAQLVPVRGNHLDGANTIATTMKEDLLPLLRWWHKT